MSDRVIIERRDNGVAIVTLNRADKRNALDPDMFRGIIAAQEELHDDKSLRAVVLRGDGVSFCAGLDFPAFMATMGQPDAMQPFEHFEQTPANFVQRVGYDWVRLPVPVIAALHGHTLGGGAQIALGADIRVAAPDLQFCIMEMVWGLIPDMSISATLPKLVGIDVAKELTYTARRIDAAEADKLGLVTFVDDDPFARALAIADQIAQQNPHAIRASKRLFDQSWNDNTTAGMQLEEDLQKTIFGTANQMEAVSARFAKREPNFQDVE